MAHILVIGGGGREHALCLKLAQSPHVGTVTVCPGNAGTVGMTEISPGNLGKVGTTDFNSRDKLRNRSLNIKNHKEVIDACRSWSITLIVIGPEGPLEEGLTDSLVNEGFKVFGPTKSAARIECSKYWAKNFMKKIGIPTADFEAFQGLESAFDFIQNSSWDGFAIKASGLAGGKGVIVANDKTEAKNELESLQTSSSSSLLEAFKTVIVEEKLNGFEVSVLAFSDGSTIKVMPSSQDHKQRFSGGRGPNTGGMGAYAPCPLLSKEDLELIQKNILQKAVNHMKEEGYPYIGVLYAGIMMTEDGPKVLEFNCRFGDPETQVLMMLLDTDLYEIMMACVNGTLHDLNVSFLEDRYAVTINVVIGSYPGDVKKGLGFEIEGNDVNEDDTTLYMAGVKFDEVSKKYTVSGGRVVNVCATSKCLEMAVLAALARAEKIKFVGAPTGFQSDFRKDIAFQAIKRIREQNHSLLTYKAAGVDIETGNEFVKDISNFTKSTKTPGVLGDLGMFGAVFDLKLAGYIDPLLVSGTDGVGTKLKIAIETGCHVTIGEDLVAMCVNDILVHGSEPLFFLDYLACGKLNSESKLEIVEGIASGCRKAGCALVGGETAEMPGMYRKSDYDLAGFAVGAVEKGKMLPLLDLITPGDVVIGISSSGLHSNGFSLVRRMIDISGISLSDVAPFNPHLTLGEELLKPTFIYTPLLKLLRTGRILAAAHNTGGGIEENLMRVIPKSLGVTINKKWPIPAVFGWLAALGISTQEMLKTFNLGIGLIFVVKANQADSILREIRTIFEEAFDFSQSQRRPYYVEDPVDLKFPLYCWNIGTVVKDIGNQCKIRGVHENLVNVGGMILHKFPTSIQLAAKKRVAVLISGSGTNLQALLNHTLSGPSAAKIVLVISNNPGVKGLERATKAGVPTIVISHKKFSSRETYDQEIHKTLLEHEIDLVFLAGFMRILSGQFVRQWSGKMVNIHPSLLPSFKGKDAQKQAFEAGVCVTGCTVHFVVEEVDAGAIITQESVPIYPEDSLEDLIERIKETEHKIFPRALELVAGGKLFLNKNGKVERK